MRAGENDGMDVGIFVGLIKSVPNWVAISGLSRACLPPLMRTIRVVPCSSISSPVLSVVVIVYPFAELEHRPGLSCKELQRLGHEVRVVLEHPAVSGIGVDDEVAVRKTPRQIVRVGGWHHAVAIAVGDQHRLVNL
jgi:hypothetical protein